MSFPKYPAYKDSGIEWLGEIPVGWNIVPLKTLANILTSNVDKKSYNGEKSVYLCNYVDVFYKDEITSDIKFMKATASSKQIEIFSLISGDVIITKDSESIEEIAIPAYVPDSLNDVLCGYHLAILRSNGKIFCRFLFWFFLSVSLKFEVKCKANGLTRVGLSQYVLNNIAFPFPPLPEQQAISRFLDRECEKIDALIAEQERLVALLAEKRQAVISHAITKGLNPNAPMKDSGIPWIGMVPEGWNIVKIGKIFSEINEPGNDSLPILSVSIHSGVSDDELSEEKLDRKVTRSDDRSKYIVVRPGDLTYNMMRAWQGGFGAVQVLGMVSPAYVVARPKNIFWQETAFIELLLRTPNAIVEMKRHSRGVTDFRLRLYWDEFKNISIPLPKWEEQNSILNFIKKKTGQFDVLSMATNKAIVLLKERRSALISAAVTGKIDVRNQSKANAA